MLIQNYFQNGEDKFQLLVWIVANVDYFDSGIYSHCQLSGILWGVTD